MPSKPIIPSGFKVADGTRLVDLDDLFLIKTGDLTEGKLWGSGLNDVGQLGVNDVTHRSVFTQNIAIGTNWKMISGGHTHTAAIKTDGTLWMWGENQYGQLGDGTITYRSSPVQTIAGGTNWKQVSVGYSHVAAIKTDGTLWCWGLNFYGACGDGTTTYRSSPVQTIAGGTNWKQVACDYYHTNAIKTDGTLWSWGHNGFGSLGDGTTVHKSSPVQTIAGGTTWKQVSGGFHHTAAIKTDGTLWTWGSNAYNAKLGDGTLTDKSSPVQTTAGGTNWKFVECGSENVSAIKTDGTLWVWGHNQWGTLGLNHQTSPVSTPVQTIASGTNWKKTSNGHLHMAALKTDGTLWVWGWNDLGQLAKNNAVHYSSPVQTASGGTAWQDVSCGGYQTWGIVNFSE